MKWVALFAFVIACASACSTYSNGYVDCVLDCYGIADYCDLLSCTQACYGEYCESYCEAIGCPPGNRDDACLVPCGSGDYHVCADAVTLAAALLSLVF